MGRVDPIHRQQREIPQRIFGIVEQQRMYEYPAPGLAIGRDDDDVDDDDDDDDSRKLAAA